MRILQLVFLPLLILISSQSLCVRVDHQASSIGSFSRFVPPIQDKPPHQRQPPLLKKRLTYISPPPSTKIRYNLTFSTVHTVTPYTPTSPLSAIEIRHVAAIFEQLYQEIAFFLTDMVDEDVFEANDLCLRLGMFTLEFHSVAQYLSMLAVKAVVQRLSQMVQRGFLGFVVGEVDTLEGGVRMVFAAGVRNL